MHTPHPREACYFGIKWVSHSIFPFPLFLERQVPVPTHRAGNGHAVSSHTALGSQPPGEHCCSLPPLGISLVQSPPSRPHRAPLAVGSQSLLMLFHNRYLRDATGPAPAPDVLRGGSRIWPWMQKGAHQHNGPPGHLLSRGTTGCNPRAGRRGAGVALGHLQPQGAWPERQQGEAFPSPPSSLSFPKVTAA